MTISSNKNLSFLKTVTYSTYVLNILYFEYNLNKTLLTLQYHLTPLHWTAIHVTPKMAQTELVMIP